MNADRHSGQAHEVASERDRAHFRAHPLALSYRRPYIPGELAGLPAVRTPDDPHAVVVAVVSDAMRLRSPVWDGQDADAVAAELEATAAAMRAGRPVPA